MEKRYVVNLTPVLCNLWGSRKVHNCSIVYQLRILCSYVGKPKHQLPGSNAFLNRLQQSAVRTQQPGVPSAMKLLGEPTGGWHEGGCLPVRPRHGSHLAQPGAFRDLLCFSIVFSSVSCSAHADAATPPARSGRAGCGQLPDSQPGVPPAESPPPLPVL